VVAGFDALNIEVTIIRLRIAAFARYGGGSLACCEDLGSGKVDVLASQGRGEETEPNEGVELHCEFVYRLSDEKKAVLCEVYVAIRQRIQGKRTPCN
jgi:hypothetical protein